MIIITILDSIFHKLVVAAFIIFVAFVVFAGRCILLSPQLLQVLLLAVYLIIAILFIIILSQGHLETSTCATLSLRFFHSVPLLK